MARMTKHPRVSLHLGANMTIAFGVHRRLAD